MYIFLVFSNFIISFLVKNKNLILFYLILSYTLIIGLRYDVGMDYLSYERAFTYNIDYEIGYNLLRNIIKLCGGKFYHLTMLVSLIIIVVISNFFKKIKKTTELRVAIFLFLISSFNFIAMNLMRQAIAVSFCFLAEQYYKKNKLFYIILIIIAFLFHKSVLLYLFLMIIIKKIKIRRKISIIFLIILFISKYFISYTSIIVKFIKIINKLYPNYSIIKIQNYATETISLNLGLLSIITIYFLVITKKNEYLINYEKYFFVSLIFLIFSTENFIFNRISFYFDIYLFYNIFQYSKEKYDGIKKKIILVIVYSILVGNFIKTGYFNSERSNLKYQTIINKFISQKSNY